MAVSARVEAEAGGAASRTGWNVAAHDAIFGGLRAGESAGALLGEHFRIENLATSAADDVYHGQRGLHDWLGDLLWVFAPGAEFEVTAVIAATDDHVVARFAITGRGAQSGLPLQFRWTAVTWFVDGCAARIVGYAAEDDALAAVGLEP
jgi:ketosteroid isomerase-like protein